MSTSPTDQLAARLRVMQIITDGLIGGAVVFLTVALYLRHFGGNLPKPPQTPILTYIALGFGVLEAIAFYIVPSMLAVSWRQKIGPQAQASRDLGPWLGMYQNYLVVGLALLEGATFLLIIAYLMEGDKLFPLQEKANVWTFYLAVGLILFMGLQWPTRDGVLRWVEEQRRLWEMERHTGR